MTTDGRLSMRSAMTTRSFHALTVRQRKVMLVNCVFPRTASQSVMKFPTLSCEFAVARNDSTKAIPISNSV